MSYGGVPYAGGAYGGQTVAAGAGDGIPTLAVEVAFTTGALETPAWVDITGDVRSWNTTRGRRRELERFQPGRATVVLSNLQRQYDSVNAAGPWFGNLRPMRRIRIRETFNGVTYPTFDGFIDKWMLDYPHVGKDATATIIATDAFKIFQRTDLPESVYAKAVSDSGAGVHWKLDETLAGLELGDAVNAGTGGSAQDATFFNTPGVGGQGLVVNDPGSSMIVPDTNVFTGALVQGIEIPNADLDLLANSIFTVEGWGRLEEGANTIGSSVTGHFLMVSEDGTSNIHASISFRDDGTGTERRIAFTVTIGGGASIFGVETPNGSVEPNKVHHIVAVVESGGQMAIYLDGVRSTTTVAGGAGSSLAGQTRATGGRVTVGHDGTVAAGAIDNWGGSIDNVSIYEGVALTQADVTTHYEAGTSPWQGDLPGARIIRILDIVEWPDGLREIDTGLTTLQSATLNHPALEHLQKVAETEFGLLFISRDGKVRFVDRTALFGRVVGPEIFGDAAGEVGYRDFVPDDGDDVIRNRALISRLNGAVRTSVDTSSVDEFGRFDFTLEGLYHRTEAYSQDYANLIVNEYHDPRRRITSMNLGPYAAAEAADGYAAMLGRELGDVITVRSRPKGGGATFEQVCAVEGIEHSGSPGNIRQSRLILSPEFSFAPSNWEDTVILGYEEVTADQGSISTLADLTGLSVTVTVAANRFIRITGHVQCTNDGTAGIGVAYIRESTTTLGRVLREDLAANNASVSEGSIVIDSPSAGSHTYKLSMEKASGAGSVTSSAAATNPAFILVEDIGPA